MLSYTIHHMPNSKIKASVVVLTCNSAKTLAQTLESVRDFDEILILDGNSTDTTRAIAQKYGAAIYSQDDQGGPNLRIASFAAMRAKGDSLAKNDWIFYLDSDEFASTELIDEIRRALATEQLIKVVYTMPYMLVVEGKLARYSFNYPRYVRVYNRRSGISWKQAKTVHEKMEIPDDIRVVDLKNFFYGHVPSYRDCLKKDAHYLALFKQKIFAKQTDSRFEVVRSIFLNAGRAARIFGSSVLVYVRHGFRESLPPSQAWRYVRYHVIITWYRIQQLFRSFVYIK